MLRMPIATSLKLAPARSFAYGLTAVICAALGFFLFTTNALAANTVSTSVYQDTDNNGTIDNVRWTMDENVTACPYEAGDWSVPVAGDIGLSVTGITCSIVPDLYIDIAVSATASMTGKQTPGGANPTISYLEAGVPTADSVTLTSGAMTDKTAIATTDGAKPLISSVAIATQTVSGVTYNAIQFIYTEYVRPFTNGAGGAEISPNTNATSTATLGAMTSARTLAGLATWGAGSGGDMTTNAATDNDVFITTAARTILVKMNYASAGYFSAGTTAPTTAAFTPVLDTNDLTDGAGNGANSAQSAITATVSTAWDVAVPTIANTYSCDVDGDGDVERFQINFSEAILDAGNAAANFEGDNDATNDGVGEETASTMNTATAGCDGNTDDTDVNDEKIRIDLTTGIAGTNAAFVNIPAVSGRDQAGNRFAAVSGGGTENDKAKPRLIGSTPASGATGVAKTATITLSFSESIASISASLSPSSTLTNSTSMPASSVVFTGAKVSGTNTFTIATAPDSTGNLYGGAGTGGTSPFSFTVASSTNTNSGGSTVTHSVIINSPNGGQTYHAGDIATVSWTGSSAGLISLYYSTSNGGTDTLIATNLSESGTYSWTVPNVSTTDAFIKAVGYDNTTLLALDSSDSAFTIIGNTALPPAGQTPLTGASHPAGMGISPITGLPEATDMVTVGDLIRGDQYPTVYYVDANFLRHPFQDAQTYLTYNSTWNIVRTVTGATLSTLTIGKPMLPKAGVVLVKIVSDPRVYALQTDSITGATLLRWIPSESVAITLYGSAWADYVIDLAPTLYTQFGHGADMTSSVTVDRSIMKTRVHLNE